MGFRGRAFAFDSPAAAVSGFIARAGRPTAARGVENVGLECAVGRILAEDVRADRDSPAFDHSAMDGYAVRAADVVAAAVAGGGSGGVRAAISLRVVGESRIGLEPPKLPAGAAVRIATGAPIPALADAIIRLEDVGQVFQGQAEEPGSISVLADAAAEVKPGHYVRRRAENARAGAVVQRAGEIISAAGLGTLAAVGSMRPAVFARLRVALITTGDEVVGAEATPSRVQVRNSNAATVAAIVASQSWADVVSVVHARDEGELDVVLEDACEHADAVILTGGVSVGHRDPVRAAVERMGAEIVFHGLPQRPGKPMLGALHVGTSGRHLVPLFGLPGNPVSAMVTCARIVLPVLAACVGATRLPLACVPRLVEVQNPDGRTLDLWWHRLAKLVIDSRGVAKAVLVDVRSSGDIVAAGESDGFLEAPPGCLHTSLPFYAWPVEGVGRSLHRPITRPER